MSRDRIIQLCTWAAIATFCFRVSAVELDEIIVAARTHENALLSLPAIYMEFQNHRQYFDKEGEFTERYVSAKQDGMFYLHRNSPALIGEKEIQHSYWYSWKDSIAIYRFERALTIAASPDLNLWDMNHYAGALFFDYFRGLDVTIPELKSMGARTFSDIEVQLNLNLVAALTNEAADWEVLAERETVDGEACVVLRSELLGEIWLDPNMDFACRRRIIRQKPFRSEYEFSLFQNKRQLWIPFEVEIKRYYPPGASGIESEEVRLLEHLTLNEISFRKRPTDFFDIAVPDHALMIDEIRGIEYTTYSKDETDDLILNRPLVQAKTRLRQIDRPPTIWHWVGVAVGTAAGLAVLGFMTVGQREE